ncbi:LOW QUALITY PROTEIN: golgin subfamily B member 1-like [Discoglossus pictus]
MEEEAFKALIEAQWAMNLQQAEMNRVMAAKFNQSQSKMRAILDAQKVQLQQFKATENIAISSGIVNPNRFLKKMTAQELESDISQLKEDLLLKKGEVENLSLLLEEKNTALENMRIFLLQKEDAIVALKSQQELQAKEHEHHCRELEMQIREVNQKQNDEVEEARSKEQLQRTLQAALISRKEALKESKSLKSELSTMRKHQQEVSNRLQAAENSLAQLSDKKAKLSEAFSRQQGERERLISEVDKCLIENQNLEISCESLKLALGGITQEKEMLEMDLMSMKNSQVSDISEYKEKLSDMQKEYEILLQSYENVGNETDRMKRAMEAVRQEKQELLNKQKKIAELEIKNQKFCNEIAELSKQKGIRAVEKDELEERLMNQLAELNGSIGNYQQDAVEYQIKNESMPRELQVQFQLEEEKRQLERQKAEALVQREYVEKLKSVLEGEKGRKTQARELQELLKEKQQEVRHLQKDCIQYQETISGLERANKALTLVQSEYEKDKLACNETIAKVMEDKKQAQADLASLQELLDGAQSETARVIAENTKLKNKLQALREDESSKLKSKEEVLEKQLEEIQTKHTEGQNNLEKLKEEHLKLEQKIVIVQDKCTTVERACAEKDKQTEESKHEIKRLKNDLLQQAKDLKSLQLDLQRKDEDYSDRKDKLADAKKHLSSKICEYEHLKKQMSSELEMKQRTIQRLKKENLENEKSDESTPLY